MNLKNLFVHNNTKGTVVSFFKITVLFLITLSFTFSLSSCSEQENNRIVIWTNCSEFAQYIEVFNNTHSNTKAVLVYKENPSTALPTAPDEAKPDIIVGSWLRTDETINNFKDLTYLFDRKILTPSIFYPQLLESGKVEKKQILLPVSFNLPAIIFSSSNKALISNNYTLTLEQIRETAGLYNKKKKNGSYTKIGFIPSSNDDFLYLTTKLFNTNFTYQNNKIEWNQENLDFAISQLSDWITTENTSPQIEQDFAFKYLFMPDYRQVTSDKTLFAYTTSDKLFKTLKDHEEIEIDYRWISDGDFIPVEDSYTMLGIYKNSPNQIGATEFITWFFNSDNQDAILSRKTKLTLNTEMFGISGGFSSLRDVTEHVIPVYYTQLFTNLPPENLLKVPSPLPSRWESYKTTVIETYVKEMIMKSKDDETPVSIIDLEREWRKKVFD